MANPFLRRATEYIRDDSLFLALVSPAPLTTFLAQHKHKHDMFQVPVRIIGAPGSGKTMLATLAEFKMVEAILKDQSSSTNRDLAAALAKAGILEDGLPRVAAVRIPMESEYRDIWELPYDPMVKTKLAFRLVQARTMLGLLRNLTSNRSRELSGIKFIARTSYEAQLEKIGGLTAEGVRDRALVVQRAVYSIAASLRPPSISNLPIDATAPYAPFDAIHRIEIDWEGKPLEISPLVMLDDVHDLHPDQLEALFGELSHREIKFGRWMMMRLDALSPGAVLRDPSFQPTHNRSEGRDFVDILMQGHSDKLTERRQFRKMALDMANRYLPQVLALASRQASDISALLPEQPPVLSSSQMNKLSRSVDVTQRQLKISDTRRNEFSTLARGYLDASKSYDTGKDIELAMTNIMMHRHNVRQRRSTPSLFGDDDPELVQPVKAKPGVADGARMHLSQQYNRPLHYGFEALCDASNENAERFLQMAGELVEHLQTRAIRNQDLPLPPAMQAKILKSKAQKMMRDWPFTHADRIRRMVDSIGRDCLEKSLAPNAPLNAGANAVGVLETEMESLLANDDELCFVLKQAIAHSALNIVRNYGQGGKQWCLIELTGTSCLAHGLTFKRGGFLEKDIGYLRRISE